MASVSPDHNPAVINPTPAGQLHSTRNSSITPHSATPSFNRRTRWFCKKSGLFFNRSEIENHPSKPNMYAVSLAISPDRG